MGGFRLPRSRPRLPRRGFALGRRLGQAQVGPKTEEEKLRDRLEGKTPDQKIDILTKIIEDGKPDKYVYFHLGGAKYDKDDAKGAAEAFEQAVAMDTTFFKAIVNLGDTYDRLQEYPKAIETYERAAALQPDNADV